MTPPKVINALVSCCLCLSAIAATIDEAEALFKDKKWSNAAAAYESVADGRGPRGEKLKAALSAALSHENAGRLKDAEKWADKIVRETSGKSDSEVVAGAFALKQRILFRRKAKPALREALLNEAVRRLGWARDVSSLYERDAFVCVKEKTFPAAYKKLSLRNVIPSQNGRG